MLFSFVFNKCAGTELPNWVKNMVNDLWSCADRWQQLLDQKCYLVVDVNSTYRSSLKMGRSSKMAWIAAIRTTRYPLILMFCCDVFMFLVKEEVFSDEDLEWPYPSCLLYGKYFFQAFRSMANKRYKWHVTKSVDVAITIFFSCQRKKNKKSSVRVCGRAYFV